jgi:hypothetical protein
VLPRKISKFALFMIIGSLSPSGLLVSGPPKHRDEAPGEYSRLLMDLVTKNANPERVGFKIFSPECGFGLIDAEKTVKAALALNIKR